VKIFQDSVLEGVDNKVQNGRKVQIVNNREREIGGQKGGKLFGKQSGRFKDRQRWFTRKKRTGTNFEEIARKKKKCQGRCALEVRKEKTDWQSLSGALGCRGERGPWIWLVEKMKPEEFRR